MSWTEAAELTGFACLVVAAFLVAAALGLAVLGAGLVLGGAAFDRRPPREEPPK